MDRPFRPRNERQHEAAVATRRAVSDTCPLEQNDPAFREALRQVQRAGQPGIAAADDDDVSGLIALERSERWRVLDACRLDPMTMRSRPEERASERAISFVHRRPLGHRLETQKLVDAAPPSVVEELRGRARIA